jgi:hypothetical protein
MECFANTGINISTSQTLRGAATFPILPTQAWKLESMDYYGAWFGNDFDDMMDVQGYLKATPCCYCANRQEWTHFGTMERM